MDKLNALKRLARSALLIAGLCAAAGAQAQAADMDQDGVPDLLDNCINVPNPDQRDTDRDGLGNPCDADLNNDGIVNALDLGLFKQRFGSRDADTDINGDGIVNALDLGALKRMFGRAPGPSGFRVDPALAFAPPVARRVEVSALDRTLPDGSNAAAFYDFGPGKHGSVLPIAFARAVPFNDAGLEPDQQAGDGIYSAFVAVNLEQAQQDEEAYLRRLDSSKPPRVFLYSGRDKVGEREFVVPQAAARAAAAARVLASGIVLTPIAFKLLPLIPLAPTVDPAKSLMITHRSVVADPGRTFDPCDVDGDGVFGNVNGAWSFKTLMTNMANTPVTGIAAQQFTHNWLLNWMSPQTVNTFTIADRTALQSFFPGWDGVNAATLNMNQLPFRLLAIVNRMDLAGASSYGQPKDAKKSETRFVFGLVDFSSPGCKAVGNIGAARRMTAIFEYGDPTSTCNDLKTRAQQWIALDALAFPSPAYNAALQALTNAVTLPNAAPAKPNGSALNQLRTNEIALAVPWQLREFVLDPPFSSLVSATVKQTPDPNLFRLGSLVTKAYMEANADAILCETHVVPLNFLGNPFLGSHTDYGFGTFWDAPTVIGGAFPGCWSSNVTGGVPTKKGEVRHKFSLNTCDDCHAGETNTVFTHVDPQSSPASLSGFLTGITVNDPGGEPVQRTFDDLTRRAQALEDLAQGCFKLPISFFMQQVAPLRIAH